MVHRASALLLRLIALSSERGFFFPISEAKPQSEDPYLHRRLMPGTFEPFPSDPLCPLWPKLSVVATSYPVLATAFRTVRRSMRRSYNSP